MRRSRAGGKTACYDMSMRLLILSLLAGLVVSSCGGDDQSEGDRGSTNPLKDAVAKTEAAKTARLSFDISISNGQSLTVTGGGEVDFEHDRERLTIETQGQTVELFGDGDEEYVRRGDSGRYQRFPASAQAPVANNPTDSLKYLGTDVVGVKKTGEEGCYKGRLDFDRIFERVDEQREDEFPAQLRGKRAPVLVCLDGEGRIRRYDVALSISGVSVDTKSTVRDYGNVASLEPLGPDERPR